MIKEGNKKAQFYFMATIVIIGLIAGIALTFNYSKKTNFYEIDEIAQELTIEGEKVLDYDTLNSANEFENFAKDYSAYVGEDKEIYFILVNGAEKHAYRYIDGTKTEFDSYLTVFGGEIYFLLNEKDYIFKFEEGKNFYFVLIYEKKGEKYVFSG